MRACRNALLVVALTTALTASWTAAAGFAAAQDLGEDLRQCFDRPTEPQLVIDTCTRLIDSSANTERGRSALFWSRARAFQRQGDTSRALADLNEAIRLNPTGPSPYEARAALFALMGDARAALESYDQSARHVRDRAEANNQRCWGRAVAGLELDRARRFCDAAVRMRPGFGSFLDSRGLVGLKQERFQDAWNDYNEALRWSPETAHFLYGRGIAALRLGRAADGEADIAAALRFDPSVADTYALYYRIER